MSPRRVVAAAAVAAFLMRFPSLLWPLRADEAGLLLVARAWSPQPDSLYGTFWVDRPPVLVGFVRGVDLLGGPGLLRLVAALGLVAMVLLAADAARTIARLTGGAHGDRLAAWAAVGAAGLAGSALIEPLAAKSEVLAIPLVMASVAAALRALERRSSGWAAGAGLAGMLALGMKQNVAGGLVFGAVLLVGAALGRRVSGRRFAVLTCAALAGAAVPVLGCLVWAQQAGVPLSTLWFDIYGFRSDAVAVIADQPNAAPQRRALLLLGTFLLGGMAAVLGWYVARWRAAWRLDRALTAAVTAMVLVDGVGLALGGSYWQAYLLVLVPDLVLALVLARATGTGRAGRVVARLPRLVLGWVVTATAISLVVWTLNFATGRFPPTEVRTGQAVAAAARPADTIVVFGGRADVVESSGLSSPYRHLWSLPMRVLDPDFSELRTLVASEGRPTWLVEWVGFDDWGNEGARALARTVRREYVRAGRTCNNHPVWLRRELAGQRPDVRPDCESPSRPTWWP